MHILLDRSGVISHLNSQKHDKAKLIMEKAGTKGEAERGRQRKYGLTPPMGFVRLFSILFQLYR